MNYLLHYLPVVGLMVVRIAGSTAVGIAVAIIGTTVDPGTNLSLLQSDVSQHVP